MLSKSAPAVDAAIEISEDDSDSGLDLSLYEVARNLRLETEKLGCTIKECVREIIAQKHELETLRHILEARGRILEEYKREIEGRGCKMDRYGRKVGE